jgi:hypothetical protein
MAKRSKSSNVRQLSDADLLKSFEHGLDTLSHLASTYDGGFSPIAFLMATEAQKILTENSAATKLRATRVFSSPEMHHTSQTLTPLHLLIGVELNGNPPKLTFVPTYHSRGKVRERTLSFREWWNKDIIYRASAAPPGTPPGMIPVNGSPTVPYEKREKITRLGLVSLLRNKLGAHQTKEMPELLDQLDEEKNWGSFSIQTPDGVFSTDDGTLPVEVSPIPAMMRQICHEILEAYGRSDPPPKKG